MFLLAVYTPTTPTHDRLVGRLFVYGALAVAAIVTAVLVRVVKGKKRPILYVVIALGVLLMLPMLLTEAWGVIDRHAIPESISVPTFLGGSALFLIGVFALFILIKRKME